MRHEMDQVQGNIDEMEGYDIDRLIIVERVHDLIGPMMPQLTYEVTLTLTLTASDTLTYQGGLQELYPVKNATLTISDIGDTATKAALGAEEDVPEVLQLSTEDPLYADIRDIFFGEVGDVLKKQGAVIQAGYALKEEQTRSPRGISNSDLTDFKDAADRHGDRGALRAASG